MVSTSSSTRALAGAGALPQDFLDRHKRERAARALAEIACEKGRGRLTVGLVTRRAKMARETFYGLFANLDEAYRYACDLGGRKLTEAMEGADGRASRTGTIEAALGALLAAAEDESALAELCLVHGWDSSRSPVFPDEALVAAVAGVLKRPDEAAPALYGEFMAGGLLGLIAERLRRGERDSLQVLLPEITALTAAR